MEGEDDPRIKLRLEDYYLGYKDALERCARIAGRCAAGWARVPDGEQTLRLDAEVAIMIAEAIEATVKEVLEKNPDTDWL